MPLDPWTVLGLESGADAREVKHAYLLRSKLLHPDRHQAASREVLAEAERAMRDLNAAWAELRDRGGGESSRPPREGGTRRAGRDTAPSPTEAFEWFMGTVVGTALRSGKALAAWERDALVAPIGQLARLSQEQQRKLRRRVLTALHADQDAAGGGSALPQEWRRNWDVLSVSDVNAGILVVLDDVMEQLGFG